MKIKARKDGRRRSSAWTAEQSKGWWPNIGCSPLPKGTTKTLLTLKFHMAKTAEILDRRISVGTYSRENHPGFDRKSRSPWRGRFRLPAPK